MGRKYKYKRGFSYRTFFRAFFITCVFLTCILAVFTGIFHAQNGISRNLYGESQAVYSAKEVKGGYEITLFGVEATVDLQWTGTVAEISKQLPVLIPPGIRLLLCALFGIEPPPPA